MMSENSTMTKMVATLMAADEKGVEGAIETLIEMTQLNDQNLNPAESEILVITAHMAGIMSSMLGIIATDKNMSKQELLTKIAYASMG